MPRIPNNADEDFLAAVQAVARLQNWKLERIATSDDAVTRKLTLNLSRASSGAVQAELDLEGVAYEGVEFTSTAPPFTVPVEGVEVTVNDGMVETRRERAIREGTAGGKAPYEGQEVTDEGSGTVWTYTQGKWIDKERLAAAQREAEIPRLTTDERDQLWPDPDEGQEYVDPGTQIRYVYWDGRWISAEPAPLPEVDESEPALLPEAEQPATPSPKPLANSRRRR